MHSELALDECPGLSRRKSTEEKWRKGIAVVAPLTKPESVIVELTEDVLGTGAPTPR